MIILYVLVPIVCFEITLYLLYQNTLNKEKFKRVTLDELKDLNCLEIGFFYKGHIDGDDVRVLLIELANRGYIKIIEVDNKIELVQTKEYCGKNKLEKLFLESIFGSTVMDENTNFIVDRTYFYEKMAEILEEINSEENKKNIYVKTSKKMQINLLIIASFFAITLPPLALYSNIENIFLFIGILLFNLISVFLLAGIVSDIFISLCDLFKEDKVLERTNTRFSTIFLKIITVLMLLGIIIIGFAIVIKAVIVSQGYLITYIVGLLAIIGMYICRENFNLLNSYGAKMNAKTRKLKQKLSKLKSTEIKNLLAENHDYFYDNLANAYMFCIQNKYIKAFEKVIIEKPKWYKTDKNFNINEFNKLLNKLTFTIEDSNI